MKRKPSEENSLIQSMKNTRDFERGGKTLPRKTGDLPTPSAKFKYKNANKQKGIILRNIDGGPVRLESIILRAGSKITK